MIFQRREIGVIWTKTKHRLKMYILMGNVRQLIFLKSTGQQQSCRVVALMEIWHLASINKLGATSEQQYLTSEVVIKDEPVEECTTLTEELFEKCTTLTELRAFRFKSERKFTENIDAVMNECSGWTPRSGQHEKIHDQVNKQSEKKKISEFETRGEVEGVDMGQKQSVGEANVLIKDNASEIELGKGSKSSEKFLPVVKAMDLKAIAEEKVKKKDLKVIAEGRVKKKGLKSIAEEKLYMNADGFASKYTDNATGTIASGTTVHETGDSEDKWQQSNGGDSPKLINKLNSQDANEMGAQNQCLESALYNEKQETVAFKSGKDKRIEEDENVCKGTVSNEVSVNKQRVCSSNEDYQCKNGGNYCEVKKGTSRPIDVLKPRSNDRVSHIEGSETNSTVDTLESKVSVLVIKGPIHDLTEFNSQESDLSFCETYMAKENSDREDCHQESLSFIDNSSGRLLVTKEGQVDVCEVSTQDSEFLSHTRLSKGTAAFCKIKNKILKNKKRMFSNGSPLEAVISGKLYNCINNPASLQGIECPVTQDTGTKFYVNHKSFKASCATFFTFKKTRREKEIAAYKRKILKSASSFHSKRGGRLSLSQKNITFHSKLRHCKKIGDTFTRTQNSVSEKYQGSVENLTVMQREHSEQECSYVSGERLSVVSGQESVVPSVESGAFQTEKHKATTQKTLMVCEEKSAENIKLQKCRETAALKEEANSLVQKSSVTGPSTFSALGMDPCSSKKPNTCAGSLQDAPECSSVNFCRASATPTGESKNYLGSRKIKTEKENCDDLITNASWGSLAEEVEYVVVRDLAVTSKEKTACLTDRNETFECTATESVTVIRNHSVLESVDDFSGDNYPVLKSKEFFGSSEKLNEFTSSEEMELSDNNLVVHENLTSLGNQSGTVPVRQRQQIADSSAIHKKQTLKSKAKTFEEICSDNWSFVTNYESRKSKKPKDANIAAEFTVQVGDVSIKIQEYSKEVDKVHPGGPSYEGEPDQPRMNESSSFSFKSESSETTEGAERHNLLGEKTSDSPDFQEDDKVIFECPCCQEILETEKLLLNHVLQTHKTYLCDYCPVPTCSVLLARNKFRIHLRQHLVTGRYQCSFCSFSASMRGAMSRHESTHTKPQVSKDYKNIKRGGSKYRRYRKKRSSREDSQDYSLDGNNAGGENRGTTALRVTRRASSEGSQKPSLRRSARTVTSGYKGEKVAFMEETKEEVSEEESEFEGDDDKQETDVASSAAPEGILRFELSETVHDASTSTLGNSIEPTVEQDIKVDGSSIGDQIFRGLPVSCCSTLLSTVNELVDHVRQCHLSTQRCPSSGIPCIDANCPVFLKATNLAVHIKSHLVPRKISCNLCTYKTNCEFALRTHTLAHNRIKGMKKKKRVLGARRCVLKHRLRLRSQALPEEKANANDTSNKVTHKKLSGQAVNAKAVIQTEPLKAGEPSILKKKTKCLYLYKRKSKLTLQYLRLEREAKKLSEKVQKLDQDIKMVIQDPSQEEEESPSQMTMNSALVSVTNSTLFRKNFLQNLAGEDTMNNDLPFNSEFSKSGKLKSRFGGASDGEKTVGRLENDKIQRKVKSGCGKSIKSKLKSQLLSKTSNKDIKKKRKVSVGGKTQVPDLKSHINKEMQDMAASTSLLMIRSPMLLMHIVQ
ncbi:uncharacterized protein [Macrobrachium rosenbergii]|uniref:uncharacterized protein n=1 Tax=Macrobrachium rosenbergii TaxID=79674 RepID=UPI0034D55AAD